MGDIYAMRRANGDWFALEVNGRLHLPLFHTVHDAFISRLRNFGMLLFQPVIFNGGMLEQAAQYTRRRYSAYVLCPHFDM